MSESSERKSQAEQGTESGSGPVILVVGVEFHGLPEEEEIFTRWYTETHSPYVFQSKRVIGAARYKLVHMLRDREAPKYLAVYQFENRQDFETWQAEEFPAALAQRVELYSDEVWEMKWGAAYEPIKKWQK